MIGGAALMFWYGFAFLDRRTEPSSDSHRKPPRDSVKTDEESEMERTPIHKRVEQVLTETRVVLPGAQALLGFQFATILLEAFDKLPASSKYIHMLSLGIMGLTVILLMTPAAHHRIVERGEDTALSRYRQSPAAGCHGYLTDRNMR